MKITKQRLKILVESMILNEGQVEDLLAANPQLGPAVDAGIRNPNHLKWLLRMEKFEPIADMAGLIPAFIQNKQRLTVKDLDLYRNPNDLRAALEALGESEGDKRRQLREGETDVVYNDEQWIVVMPHTMESSIQWGKGTKWCTAATKSANLFYSYVGRKDQDIILFYIINKNSDSRIDNTSKLSVGFVNGTPLLDGKNGGLSVNASNIGIEKESLKKILDTKLELIMSAMKSHSEKIKSKHPAKQAMQKIAQAKNPSVLEKYTAGMNLKERKDFIKILLEYDLSSEMSSFFARDEDKEVRSAVARNHGTPAEILTRLANEEYELVISVRNSAIKNPNMPIEILTRLANDEDEVVRLYVAENPNTPAEVFSLLEKDKASRVRSYVALNPNTPSKVLTRLANDEDEFVRSSVLSNPNTPIELLNLFASDPNSVARMNVAYNFNTPAKTLALLASDEDVWVKRGVAKNPSAPLEALTRLARDKDKIVRSLVAANPNIPLEVLTQLARDKNKKVRGHIDSNPTYQKYLESQKQLNERWIRLAGLLN